MFWSGTVWLYQRDRQMCSNHGQMCGEHRQQHHTGRTPVAASPGKLQIPATTDGTERGGTCLGRRNCPFFAWKRLVYVTFSLLFSVLRPPLLWPLLPVHPAALCRLHASHAGYREHRRSSQSLSMATE